MYQPIASLDLPRSKISKLKHLGKNYCEELTHNSTDSLSIELPEKPLTVTAVELLQNEFSIGSILSYNSELDKVLRDEVTPQRITEIAGYPGSGKTQICFQLSITVQLSKHLGGLDGQAVYINTRKSFSSYRVRQLARKFIHQVNSLHMEDDKSENEILKNILVFDISNVPEMFAALKLFDTYLETKHVRLLIIDSISTILREVEAKERSSLIYTIFEDLQKLAIKFNFAVIVTNDFTTLINNNETIFTPSFGDSFCDRVNSRICLSKYPEIHDVYTAELIKSFIKPYLKVDFCMF